MHIILVIPARMKSTRFPGKPLTDILGKSMIQRTYEQCLKAFPAEKIYVATDSKIIEKHCRERNIQVVMTSESCLTGTDRVAEVSDKIEADYYINVQGDEPLINPQDILDVERTIHLSPGDILNGYAPIREAEMWRSASIPKVVVGQDGRLLYMSRSPVPGNKTGNFEKGWRQICVYAYPKAALDAFVRQGKKTELEETEDLEILRFLEMGFQVRMVPLSEESVAVDHPEDVQKVIRKLQGY